MICIADLIETGDAAPASGAWRYTAKTPLPAGSSAIIEAIATDRPGNSASLKQSWPVAKAAGTDK
ncbi:MAG: hypothetical protein Q7S40_17400 [Opitutaceae bacterium]|nr:hypothetical protein [Opitutaceae bacterium]